MRTLALILSGLLLTMLSLAAVCRQEWRLEERCWSCTVLANIPLMPAPIAAWAFNGRGLANHFLSRTHASIADFGAAVGLAPRNARYHNNLGNAFLATGRPELALTAYSAAVELDPGYGRAIFNRGTTKLALGRIDQALADIERAVVLQPKASSPLTVRGNIRLMQGNTAGSLADHTQALRLTNEFPVTLLNRACTHLARGEIASAALDRTRANCARIAEADKPRSPSSCRKSRIFARNLVELQLASHAGKLRIERQDLHTLRCPYARAASE